MVEDSDIIHKPSANIVIREEPDTKRLYINSRSLRNWCSKKQIDYTFMVKNLRNNGVCFKEPKYIRLGKGYIKSPPVSCLILDSDKVDSVDKDEGEDE